MSTIDLFPGDHVEFYWNSDEGNVRGILLRTFVNGEHGVWGEIWKDHITYSLPIDKCRLLPSPRQVQVTP